jgi:hypothetical protein
LEVRWASGASRRIGGFGEFVLKLHSIPNLGRYDQTRFFLAWIAFVPIAGAILTILGGNLVGLFASDGELIDKIMLAPTWVLPSSLGFLAGLYLTRKAFHRANLFVWLIPALLFVYTWLSVAYSQNSRDSYELLLGRNCGDNECLSELFVTMPLVFSIAFSAAAMFQKIRVYFRNA